MTCVVTMPIVAQHVLNPIIGMTKKTLKFETSNVVHLNFVKPPICTSFALGLFYNTNNTFIGLKSWILKYDHKTKQAQNKFNP